MTRPESAPQLAGQYTSRPSLKRRIRAFEVGGKRIGPGTADSIILNFENRIPYLIEALWYAGEKCSKFEEYSKTACSSTTFPVLDRIGHADDARRECVYNISDSKTISVCV